MSVLRILLDFLFPPRKHEEIVRDLTLSELGALVRPTLYPDGRIALMPYRVRAVRASITEAKFRGNEHAETLLGGVLHDFLIEWTAETQMYEPYRFVLIPLPLSNERRRERGYNQTERIAHIGAKALDTLSVDTHLLVRSIHTAPQTSLKRNERLQNIRDAFTVTDTPHPDYTYIVFDDVTTTGATLQAAVHALTKAGAKRVIPLSLAH